MPTFHRWDGETKSEWIDRLIRHHAPSSVVEYALVSMDHVAEKKEKTISISIDTMNKASNIDTAARRVTFTNAETNQQHDDNENGKTVIAIFQLWYQPILLTFTKIQF